MNPRPASKRRTSAEDARQKQRTGLVTLVFTDLVGSTAIKQQLGDRSSGALFEKHHQLVRDTLGRFPNGQEIETAGDSFLMTFATPSDAVQFALVLQSRLRKLKEETGVEVRDRVGIHIGEVVIKAEARQQKPRDLYGIQIDTCSRVMSLAHAGKVLMTRSVFDSARQVLKGEDIEGVGPLEWLNHGPYLLKGLEEAVEICEAREAGQETETDGPPTSSEKAKRQVVPGNEQVLGWRPAVGQLVPKTKWVLEEKLGEGGFGEVWLGLHQTMKEHRVFKFCFQAERVRFLKRELTLFRVLKERFGDHPNIVRLHEVFLDEPPCYVEMDYVEGKDLRRWCEDHGGIGRIPWETRLEIVAQTAEALKAAHESGIIHRDVKPTNILVGGKGVKAGDVRVKLTDFGIGQVVSQEYLAGITQAGFTETLFSSSSSSQTGTHLYMAPELTAGRPASTTADIYSLGVVLYQLLVEDFSEPVTTDWMEKVSDPVLREDLKLCFAGDPTHRFTGVGQLAENLRTVEERRRSFLSHERQVQMRKQVKVAVVASLVLLLGLSTGWFYFRNAKTRWAREKALPEIARLADAEEFSTALRLARRAQSYIPNDPALTNLLGKVSVSISVETTPPGANIYIKEYRNPEKPWEDVGKSPINGFQLARGFYRWRVTKDGYEPVERALFASANRIEFKLALPGSIPLGMVRVEGTTNFLPDMATIAPLQPIELGDFLIDKFEVTNKQFKDFVDAGGYQNTNFWRFPFPKEGRGIPWAEAMSQFRDQSGKPGPSAWLNGSYPFGQADYPVTGVNWFEADAFATYAGKSLPTIFHWYRSAGARDRGILIRESGQIVPLSNFSKQDLAPVGKYQGMSPWGVYDMAGNAGEWCWNATTSGNRSLLGGAWDDYDYWFSDLAESDPFDRSPGRGFRCMKALSEAGISKAALASVTRQHRDYKKEKPVSNEIFQVYKNLFDHDRSSPLDSIALSVDDGSALWKKEKIVFNAAYGDEKVPAYLFLPKKFSSPYQAIIYFPHAGALRSRSSEPLVDTDVVETLLLTGRAVLYPIYKGTYERGSDARLTREANAERIIRMTKDFRRSIDYLHTREDIDHDKLAYVGVSFGAATAARILAVEDRVKIGVLIHGGLWMGSPLPHVDVLNFVPRVTIPILMVNGRHDSTFPLETSQVPLFQLLGTPPEHKQHIIYPETGHTGPPRAELVKQMKSWLDKYLGPVK